MMRKSRLFCFPYAGGSASVYSHWENYFDHSIQLQPIELAGRGKRINEPFYASLDDAADDVIRQIKNKLYDLPFAFYGHSLGGAVAYQVALKLREMKFPQPIHVFISGRGAPHIRRKDKPPYHTLPENEFKEKIMELGGTPEELFLHPELLEILLPLLRADFRISWLFSHQFIQLDPLDCDLSILVGKQEDLNSEQIDEWKLHTNGDCNIHYFEGGHFFINDPIQKRKMLDIVQNAMISNLTELIQEAAL